MDGPGGKAFKNAADLVVRRDNLLKVVMLNQTWLTVRSRPIQHVPYVRADFALDTADVACCIQLSDLTFNASFITQSLMSKSRGRSPCKMTEKQQQLQLRSSNNGAGTMRLPCMLNSFTEP